MAWVIDQWVWGHVLWVITHRWRSFVPGSVGSQTYGVTQVIIGSPILRSVAIVQNSFSLKASVAPRDGSNLSIYQSTILAETITK